MQKILRLAGQEIARRLIGSILQRHLPEQENGYLEYRDQRRHERRSDQGEFDGGRAALGADETEKLSCQTLQKYWCLSKHRAPAAFPQPPAKCEAWPVPNGVKDAPQIVNYPF